MVNCIIYEHPKVELYILPLGISFPEKEPQEIYKISDLFRTTQGNIIIHKFGGREIKWQK